MRFPRILRSIVYDHSPINPTSIYFSPCRSHRILDPARRIAKLSRNKRRFNKIRLRYYSFPMFISELFVVATPLHPLHPRILLRDPLVFPEARRRDERRGRVTLFPISLTSLERAPPLAPPLAQLFPLTTLTRRK